LPIIKVEMRSKRIRQLRALSLVISIFIMAKLYLAFYGSV
jgi:hypothetical protein